IILWHTLNTDKNIVEKLILDRYGNFPEIAQHIKQLKGITAFKDFGKLSRKFLCELRGGIDFTTGAVCSVLDLLYETNQNLNEILYDEKYGFLQLIQEENGENDTEITAETLRDRGLSPSVRRGVWQALQMADEYISALHRKPDKIFVEVTRSDEKKNDGKGLRTVSRREMLLALYKDAKDASRLVQELNRKTDSDLRQERLYLYFRQLGQCAYTGKTIELEQLSGEMYDVDHIVPQSLTKDDSIDNKVLVLRECNARKSDTYPLPDSLRNKKLWDDLHDRKLMSDKKYALLTRTEPLHTEDFTQFINRQIVVTGQTAKAVAELLHKKYGAFGTKIVYSKAQNVSEFRHKYNLYKCRETNDLHHARDAYLNIAVGNVYDTKFSNVRSYFYEKKSDGTQRQYNLKTLFDKPVAGAWDPQTSLDIVRKTLAKNSMAVTRYAYIGTGNFYDETIYKKGDGGIAAPRKMQAPYTDTERYGGFKSLTTAYFLAVQSKGKKGETVKTLERIPVLTDCAEKTSPDAVMRYLTEQAGLVDPQIVSGKIKVKSAVSVNGTPVWLAGVTGVKIVVHNAVQWFTDAQTDRYVNALVKLAEWKKSGKLTEEETKQTEFCMHANRLHGALLSVNAQNNVALYEKIAAQLRLPLYGGISGMRNFCRTVEKRAEKFRLLSVWEQTQVLLQLVKFLKCNAECANLTLLGEGATCGKLTIHKNISDMVLETVNVSPCGLTVRRRKI
ncbi:MAG: type II CRISPR RNA-guided endonuclease Cas9, partial [Clostridiales bacterium]|nr:type II CRISPR RNA-guided endonuclease Cas9 [Clostridiales bacterium]